MPTLLILAASPLDQDRLRLGVEVKKIRQSLERSRNRENWRIESNEAANVEELRRSLLDYQPAILHFSGHGAGDSGLCFENDDGQSHPTKGGPLGRLFHNFRETLKCVVLNACYSAIQGREIREEIDYVVGMQSSIDDNAATKFAVSFYDAIFAGTNFRAAFELGCAALELSNLPDTKVPVFLTSTQLGQTELTYSADVPEIEKVILAYINTPFDRRYLFTTNGEKIIDLMRRHYGDASHTLAEKVSLISKRPIDDKHWKVSVLISAHDSFNGYVQRGTKAYKEILDILSDGNLHDITLSISNINDDTDQPIINSLVSRTWIVPEN